MPASYSMVDLTNLLVFELFNVQDGSFTPICLFKLNDLKYFDAF